MTSIRPGDSAGGWVPDVASALTAVLWRTLGHGAEMQEPGGDRQLLEQLARCLLQALAEGGIGLDTGPKPPSTLLDTTDWPQRHRRVLEAAGWLGDHAPLVEAGGHWCWRRWHDRQLRVDELLARHCGSPVGRESGGQAHPALGPEKQQVVLEGLSACLDPDQRRAVAAVFQSRLILLSGGPGTGKTTTVASMLVALHQRWPSLRLQLSAPTGKASARLRQAISDAWSKRNWGDPPPAATLHRLLVGRATDSVAGERNRAPLPIDVLVIDEMSMVDVALMEGVLRALPSSSQIVLVGDPDQLPPIAPGAVWDRLHRSEADRPAGAAHVTLRRIHRNRGAVAELAGLIRERRKEELCHRLSSLPTAANVRWRERRGGAIPPEATSAMCLQANRLRGLAEGAGPGEHRQAMLLLKALDETVVLAPRRQGPWGVDTLQRSVLGDAMDQSIGQWPIGTPVLCCRNLPECELVNGDVGVVIRASGLAWLLFADGSGQAPRWFSPGRVPDLEPALALTIHKAQGSQYEKVTLLMPSGVDADLRLLYTGFTRARNDLMLITPAAIEEL